MCIIVENKEDVSAFKDFKAGTSEQSVLSQPSSTPAPPSFSADQSFLTPSLGVSASVSAITDAVNSRIKASPYAKKIAAETGVDLSVFFCFF